MCVYICVYVPRRPGQTSHPTDLKFCTGTPLNYPGKWIFYFFEKFFFRNFGVQNGSKMVKMAILASPMCDTSNNIKISRGIRWFGQNTNSWIFWVQNGYFGHLEFLGSKMAILAILDTPMCDTSNNIKIARGIRWFGQNRYSRIFWVQNGQKWPKIAILAAPKSDTEKAVIPCGTDRRSACLK